MRKIVFGLGVILLLSYFIVWQKGHTYCCQSNVSSNIIDSTQLISPFSSLIFCYGSSDLDNKKYNPLIVDSIKNLIRLGLGIRFIIEIDSSEYHLNQDVGIERAENLIRYIKSIDSNVMISYEYIIVDSLYFRKDSCIHNYRFEYVSNLDIDKNNSVYIIPHIDEQKDLVLNEQTVEKLDRVMLLMKQSNQDIQIVSFLSDTVFSKADFNLTSERAKAIKNYLVENGAESKSIQLNYFSIVDYKKEFPELKVQMNQSLIKFLK